jgi:hypothetical protein
MTRWIRSCVLALLIILRQMGRQREPTKCWRICFEPMLFSMIPAGIQQQLSGQSEEISFRGPVWSEVQNSAVLGSDWREAGIWSGYC